VEGGNPGRGRSGMWCCEGRRKAETRREVLGKNVSRGGQLLDKGWAKGLKGKWKRLSCVEKGGKKRDGKMDP